MHIRTRGPMILGFGGSACDMVVGMSPGGENVNLWGHQDMQSDVLDTSDRYIRFCAPFYPVWYLDTFRCGGWQPA